MVKYAIKPPFFEIGPKAYLYGQDMLNLALAADAASEKYDVRVILTPQYTDIPLLVENTEHLLICAQHMDPLQVGRGLGAVLPEAIKAAGAVGVMLNHMEKPMYLSDLRKAIHRAREVGLISIVCADSLEDAKAIACFSPDVIVAEPSELIGTGKSSGEDYVRATNDAIRSINSNIQILQAAGISNGKDVYDVIRSGAEGTGSTSGIIKASDPFAMIDEMLAAVRKAWDETH